LNNDVNIVNNANLLYDKYVFVIYC